MASAKANQNPDAPDTPSQPSPTTPRFRDIVIARAVAEAVRSVPSVVGLSAGHSALAATYGPRDRVTGVVVRHPSPQDIVVEVHVIVRASVYAEADEDTVRAPTGTDSVADAVLVSVADAIRDAVYRVAHEIGITSPARVDIHIDDIQPPA